MPTVRTYDGMYLGNMDYNTAKMLIKIRNLDRIANLEKTIFTFPSEYVIRVIEEGISMRDILKEKGELASNYVGKLRPYQTTGVGFMYLSPRSMIADGVGMGKTVEIAGLLNYLRLKGERGRFCMIVERSAYMQTVAELTKYTGMNILMLPSEAHKMRKVLAKTDWSRVDGIIMKHGAIRSDEFSRFISMNIGSDGYNTVFNTFILDESSVIKNDTTKAYDYLSTICDVTRRVHFMNATVFEKHILDIYNQFYAMDKALMPSKSKIKNEFCEMSYEYKWTKRGGKASKIVIPNHIGYKNEEEFKRRMQLVYLARSKKQVGLDIQHQYMISWIETTHEQELAIARGNRYNEVLNCPSLVPDMGVDNTLNTVPKLARLVDLVVEQFQGLKVMVYVFHIEAQTAIKKALEVASDGKLKIEILNGHVNDIERIRIQNEFNIGDLDVIITNVKKSINLYVGDVCILYSMETTPATMEQIRGRIDRSIDDKEKTFVLMLYENTGESSFFMDRVKQRAIDARALTIDSKTAIDYFIDSINNEGE